MRRWVKWAIFGVVGAVALFFVGVIIYITLINDPAPELSFERRDEQLESTTTAAATTTEPAGQRDAGAAAETTAPPPATEPTATAPADVTAVVDGTWVATDESELGYRVKEVLGGLDTEGVGRTNEITGSLTIEGTAVTAAEFEVDMASVTSDSGNRDNQFRGRIMDVATHPTSRFVLTEPLDFGAVPLGEEPLTAVATGELTLRGTTNVVTFDVEARLARGQIEVLGDIPIVFADYDIPNPSFGPARTEDNGLLEFLLVFSPSS